MEPGHVGRVEMSWGTEYMNLFTPQWSPATWAGWSGGGVVAAVVEE